MTSSISSTSVSILKPAQPISPNAMATHRSVKLDFSPEFGFQAFILLDTLSLTPFEKATVETRFTVVGNFKEQMVKMGSQERESHFLNNFKVEVERQNDKSFR